MSNSNHGHQTSWKNMRNNVTRRQGLSSNRVVQMPKLQQSASRNHSEVSVDRINDCASAYCSILWFQCCRITLRSLTFCHSETRKQILKPQHTEPARCCWQNRFLSRKDERHRVSQKEQTLWLTLITKKPHSLPTGFCAQHSGTAEQRASEIY